MSNEEIEKLKAIFAKRLKELIDTNNVNQAELAQMLKVDNSTVGKWLSCKAYPRMGIVEKLSVIFNVPKNYFLDEDESRRTYYMEPETAALAQQIHDDPELRILMDASRKLRPEELKSVINMIKAMKGIE